MDNKYNSEVIINAISGKKSRHFNYEYKIKDGKDKYIIGIRHSKKGGSTLSRALYDLIFLAGKIDEYWLERLVNDKDFPIILKAMQDAYNKRNPIGWSPDVIKELKDYQKEVKKNEQ